MAVIAKSHPLAERATISLADLATETFVSIPRAAAPGFVDGERTMFARHALSRGDVIEAPCSHAQLASSPRA